MDMAQELCEETSQICTEELFLRADIEREIFGQRDDYVRRIENELGVTILSRNGAILVSGGKKGVRQAVLTLNQLAGLAKRGTGIVTRRPESPSSRRRSGRRNISKRSGII